MVKGHRFQILKIKLLMVGIHIHSTNLSPSKFLCSLPSSRRRHASPPLHAAASAAESPGTELAGWSVGREGGKHWSPSCIKENSIPYSAHLPLLDNVVGIASWETSTFKKIHHITFPKQWELFTQASEEQWWLSFKTYVTCFLSM